MATLKVNFVFTTDWTATGNSLAVSAQLENTLKNIDAYNMRHDSNKRVSPDGVKPVSKQHSVEFVVYINSNAKATTKLVTQELEAFIDAVDAYNVTLDITHNLFNVAYKPAKTFQGV